MHAFDVLGDPVRRRILELLADGELSAGQVTDVAAAEFGISQPTVSGHLRVLRETGFARVRREGARRLYAVEPAPLQEVDLWLDGFRRFWSGPLDPWPPSSPVGAGATPTRAGRPPARRRKEPDVNEIASQEGSLTQVERSMGTREIAEGPARTAVLRRRYPAPVADVWAAITTPDRLDRFFLPVSGELPAGGSYALEGQASGEILVCDPPSLLRLEWTPPDDRGYSDQVEIRLTADGPGATWLELEHASVADAFRNDPEAGCYGVGTGWEGPLHYLGEYLRGVLPDRPSAEWYAFDEAEEQRLADHRGREWAAVEARHAQTRDGLTP